MVKFFTTMGVAQLAVICSIIFKVNGNDLPVKSENDAVSVRPGEEALLTCMTDAKLKFCTFVSPSKSSYNIDKDIPHYNDHLYYAEVDGGCGVRIKNVEEKDDGEWRCELTSLVEGTAIRGSNTISLTVLKAPRSVSLNVAQEVSVSPPASGLEGIRCTAMGGHPAPSFSWTLDDQPANVEVVATAEEGDDSYYQEINYNAKKEDDGKILKCVANSEAYTADERNAGINVAKTMLDIQFKPAATKDLFEFYGLTVGKPFEIRISFRLNPGPNNMIWTMQDGTVVPQGSESENGKYTAKMAEQGPVAGEENMYSALLVINDVKETDTDTVNTLKVTNIHGEAEIKFKLALGAKPPVEAGTGPVIAIVIIVLILIVIIAVAVVARFQGLLCFAVAKVSDEDKEKAVDKEEGSDTESADQTEPEATKTETDGEAPKPVKKTIPARMTGLLTAMKKTMSPAKKPASNTPESEELKEGEEKKDDIESKDKDDIVYADLDKSAMTEGNATISVENEKTEYAEIKQ